MGNCNIRQINQEGTGFVNYTCDNIEDLKDNFRKVNRTDEINGVDKAYVRYCESLESFCHCKIPLQCSKCLLSEHEGHFCRCEDRNIKLAKQLRKEGGSWINVVKPTT